MTKGTHAITLLSKAYRWSTHKNEQLARDRGLSFEDIIVAIESGGLIDIVQHPNAVKYPGQRIFLVHCNNYVWLVPIVEDLDYFFLKTAIPSRKATRDHLKRGKSNDET